MTQYVIAELKQGEQGGFCPRGAAADLWRSRDHECIIAGPAESGKTFACCVLLDSLLWRYEGAQAVMARKTYASLVGSALQTYRRIIGPETHIKAYGNNKPEWFDYPNGSRLWLAGLDNPQKALSSERDFIYVNQAEELELKDWETLTTRCTGRGSELPYARIFGDCNPGSPQHWILHRQGLKLLESRHEDNPTLFTDDGVITEQGTHTLTVLDALTGVRYLRLRKGKWVQAEGVVYENFDRAVHLIDRFEIPQAWPRFLAVDFGYTNPFVCQWYARDPDGRLYLYREIYHSKILVEDHARRAKDLSAGEPAPKEIICDHDAEGRATFERYFGATTKPAHKSIIEGIQAVQARLSPSGDGKPRLFIMRDSLDRKDPVLEEKRLPCCTAEEMDLYVWKLDGSRKKGEEPEDANNHGCDSLRYMVADQDVKGRAPGFVVSGYGGSRVAGHGVGRSYRREDGDL